METTAVVTQTEHTKKVKDPTEVAVVAEVVVVLEMVRTKTMITQRTP